MKILVVAPSDASLSAIVDHHMIHRESPFIKLAFWYLLVVHKHFNMQYNVWDQLTWHLANQKDRNWKSLEKVHLEKYLVCLTKIQNPTFSTRIGKTLF